MRSLCALCFILLTNSVLANVGPGGYPQDFESGEWGDSAIGWAATRDFNNYNDIQINTLNPFNGNRSVMLPLVDTMPFGQLHWWLLYCKSAYWTNGLCTDSAFMHKGFVYGTEVSYWFYIPAGAPIDSFIVFNRDSDWSWCTFGKYMPGDLTFGAWNNLIAPTPETLANGDTIDLPIIQFDVWIFTDSSLLNPSCTLYMDDIRAGNKDGIGIPKKGSGVLSVSKSSINFIEYSLSASAHILIEIFNLSGQKVAVEVPGGQFEGPHKIYVDLPAGIYLVGITAGKEKGFGKFISVK